MSRRLRFRDTFRIRRTKPGPMPGCVLRASGVDFDADSFLRSSPFEPCRIWRRGEPQSHGRPEPHDTGGFNLSVSDAGGDHLADQIRDALAFLHANHAELRRLVTRPGLAEAYLDFGCDSPHRETPARFHRLPPDIRECAALGLAIELSVYAVDRIDDDAEADEP